MMRCELCGKDSSTVRPAYVDGARLSVCQGCVRFSDESKGSRGRSSGASGPSLSVIEERLERRQRRMKARDVYAVETKELVLDYQDIIKDARREKGWDQEALAKNINERKSVVTQIEAGSLTPSDQLIRKLERALDVKLTEMLASTGGQKGSGSGASMTLGDFIRKE